MIEWSISVFLFLLLIILFWKYAQLKGKIEQKAKYKFEEWAKEELNKRAEEIAGIHFAKWKIVEEKKIRADARKSSTDIITGQVKERLSPYFPNFPYNPRDVRFLGSPIDLIVFDGLSKDNVEKIIFVEVKTGNKKYLEADLKGRERSVEDCLKQKKVYHQKYCISNNNQTLDEYSGD